MTWTQDPEAAQYFVMIGTTPGNGNVFGTFVAAGQSSLALPPLPAGPTLWATVDTDIVGMGWNPSESVSFTVNRAVFTYPLTGSDNLGTLVAMTWTQAPAAAVYYVTVGTTTSNDSVFAGFVSGTQDSLSIPSVPTGETLWAQIWTEMPGQGWYASSQVSFTATA